MMRVLPSLSSALRFTLVPLLLSAAVAARAETASPATASGLFQVLLGLVVVLGLMAAAAWTVRRLGLMKNMPASTVKVVGGVNVGNRERILVVEVADQWIVVGVAPGRVNALSTMPRREVAAMPTTADAGPQNFSAWLKQTIEKRNGR
ncbi:flagellar biosynthetic protein FliO [Noviherbaspirillum cavernae]|uniref:Flagellar protein n=1 Tax=Noviherbaspirillum cavernae TaxID=2320862 RepID=A0A418X0J4_9BURK|nr:flagellar biosynthetic protein FliO [Noviherbaspirillum cavernae]RJG05952.1 flagellar biosynthetic protein FliO [Noviherbaspirillum cavernae]